MNILNKAKKINNVLKQGNEVNPHLPQLKQAMMIESSDSIINGGIVEKTLGIVTANTKLVDTYPLAHFTVYLVLHGYRFKRLGFIGNTTFSIVATGLSFTVKP